MSCFIIVSGGSITGIDKNVYRPAALTSESVSYKARFSLQVGGAAGGPIPAGQGSGPAGEGRRGFARPRGAARQGRGQTRSALTQDGAALRVPGSPPPEEPGWRGPRPRISSALRAPAPLGLALGAQCLPRSSEFSFSVRSKRPIHSRLCTSSEYRRLVCALTPSTNGKTECNSNTIDIEFTRTMD